MDEDDVWDKIRMQQLEAEADRFREERLLGKCWGIWVQGCRWIMVRASLRKRLYYSEGKRVGFT